MLHTDYVIIQSDLIYDAALIVGFLYVGCGTWCETDHSGTSVHTTSGGHESLLSLSDMSEHALVL